MAMTVEIQYGAVFGALDASDWFPYELELTDEEEIIYRNAVRLRKDLNEIAELEDALQRAYEDIEEEQIDLCIENGDEYAMECQGCQSKEPDEINDLVAERDEHTLEFFGLTDLSEDELNEWDAHDVDMPTVAEFDPGFKPCSPFDGGWELRVEFINPYENDEMPEEEARMILKELLQTANGDYSEVEDFIDRCEMDFIPAAGDDKTLDSLAEEIADELGLTDYSA